MGSYSPPPPKPIMPEEPDYTSYASVGTVDDTVKDEVEAIEITNDGYAFIKGYLYLTMVTPSLAISHISVKNTDSIYRQTIAKSMTSKYIAVLVNETTAHIYKAGSLFQTLTLSNFYSSGTIAMAIGISPNGKYVAVAGYDWAGLKTHVQLFQAS